MCISLQICTFPHVLTIQTGGTCKQFHLKHSTPYMSFPIIWRTHVPLHVHCLVFLATQKHVFSSHINIQGHMEIANCIWVSLCCELSQYNIPACVMHRLVQQSQKNAAAAAAVYQSCMGSKMQKYVQNLGNNWISCLVPQLLHRHR